VRAATLKKESSMSKT